MRRVATWWAGVVLIAVVPGCQREITRHEQILSSTPDALRKATATLDGVTDAPSAQAAVDAMPRNFVNGVELHQLGAPDPKAKERVTTLYKEFETAASDFAKAFRNLEAKMAQQGPQFKTSPLNSAVMLAVLAGGCRRVAKARRKQVRRGKLPRWK